MKNLTPKSRFLCFYWKMLNNVYFHALVYHISFLEWVMDEQMDHPPSNHFLAIDENSIFNGSGLSPMGGKMIRSVAATTSRNKSPLSDLNPPTVPPVSLPDLRPVSH